MAIQPSWPSEHPEYVQGSYDKSSPTFDLKLGTLPRLESILSDLKWVCGQNVQTHKKVLWNIYISIDGAIINCQVSFPGGEIATLWISRVFGNWCVCVCVLGWEFTCSTKPSCHLMTWEKHSTIYDLHASTVVHSTHAQRHSQTLNKWQVIKARPGVHNIKIWSAAG